MLVYQRVSERNLHGFPRRAPWISELATFDEPPLGPTKSRKFQVLGVQLEPIKSQKIP